jgi:hypothetical protein
MLRIKNEMELDCVALLAHSDRIWARLGGAVQVESS